MFYSSISKKAESYEEKFVALSFFIFYIKNFSYLGITQCLSSVLSLHNKKRNDYDTKKEPTFRLILCFRGD